MATPVSSEQIQTARRALQEAGQPHVMAHFEQLAPERQAKLLDQIASVDWPEVGRLIQTHVRNKPTFTLPKNVQPAPWYPNVPPADMAARYEQARAHGWNLVKAGKVAAFTVAGGQGTRLGWDGPKGTFPATAIRKASLFQCFAEYLLNVQRRTGAIVPWYIMTSPINDAATRQFFKDHRFFGLDSANVMIFPQAMMPAIDMAGGKVLLDAPDSIALSPNGHGGSLKALYSSGAIADMNRRGIEHISYIQVDNPIVRIIDPLFLGLHDLDRCQMSSKMLPKREPLEKLGNFCLIDGKMTVIEYSDLPDDLAHERLPNGQLRFLAGSIAIHALRVDFVESLNKGGDFSLPFHRAEKKVPFIDANGTLVKPEKVNAVKLETFVFDALPLCDQSIIYETDRADEFGPIKNADGPGVLDCPATSKLIQTARAARWLEAAGVHVPRCADGSPDAVLEISQTSAIYPEDVARLKLPAAIEPRAQVLL